MISRSALRSSSAASPPAKTSLQRGPPESNALVRNNVGTVAADSPRTPRRLAREFRARKHQLAEARAATAPRERRRVAAFGAWQLHRRGFGGALQSGYHGYDVRGRRDQH